jgi:hypothetical protein
MKFLLTLLFTMFAVCANAYVVPTQRDIKPASQAMLEYQRVAVPVIANTTRVKALTATSASVTTTITTFAAQPDVPRNLTVTTGGTTADCKAANVTISGTNFFGRSISETFAIADNQAGSTAGAKAFKTVTSVSIPAQDGAGCTYSVGVGDALGLKRCMKQAGDVAWAVFNGAYESTRPTCLASASAVESNTCDINGTLDGAKNVDLYFVQNFACLP